MDKLVSMFYLSDQSLNRDLVKELGHCIAHLIVDDFSTRIFPSSSQDNESLKRSISTPFFVICRIAFADQFPAWPSRPITLLIALTRIFEATGFLILYFLRGKFANAAI